MQNYVKICGVHFFYIRREKHFLGKSGQTNRNCQFKQKFSTKTNLNMRNPMMMFTFFDRKYLFGQIWSKKIKIVSLSRDVALE